MNEVLCERHDGWAELILNRPDRRNAIDGPLAEAMLTHLLALNADSSIRVIVLRGAGGALCSGLDLKAFSAEPAPPWLATFNARWAAVHQALLDCPKVLIVALERYAINGGAALALAGDLLICGAGAYLQVGEVQIGMAAPKNIAWLALRHGEATAARLCLLGDRMDAQALMRERIATEVVADDEVVARACALAQRIAAFPPTGPSRIKTALRAASLLMAPGDWFAAAAAHDPQAGQTTRPPRQVKA
ncbi:MAG TPA: enoyl-CoA hydratase/isomerase family protein [Burkholderiaceae bacterium]|nr:enoyl-CoA hydratase/isomerase family protein [Burkholderiaceae bacterium]